MKLLKKRKPEPKKPCGIKIVPKGTIRCMYSEAFAGGFYYFGRVEFQVKYINFPRGQSFTGRNELELMERICGLGPYDLKGLRSDLRRNWSEDTIEAVRAEMDAWVEEVKAFFEANFGGTITVEYEPVAEAFEDESSNG